MATGSPLATRGYVGGSGGAGDTTPPTVTAVSPDPDAAPGDVGGFSADFEEATDTPIVLQIADTTPGVALVMVVARFIGSSVVEVAYRDGAFRGNYIAGSSQVIASNITLTIRRDEGWPGSGTNGDVVLDVDAVDGDGNWTSESFLYTLPESVTIEAEPEPAPASGTVDHVTAALARVRSQFRD